jgi:hypothetical protein
MNILNIVFSANNLEEILTLPIIPSEFVIPEIINKNEEFEIIGGVDGVGALNLIGLGGLRTLSIASFFPNKYYSFAKVQVDGYKCVNFFKKWSKKRVPIRIIVTDTNGKKMLNMACTIESFISGVDYAGDFPYTLELKEFVFPVVV